MAYETLINTALVSPVQKKKIYEPSKMIKKVFKAACKIFKDSSHKTLPSKLNHSISSIEEYQNWQNEQLEQSVVDMI